MKPGTRPSLRSARLHDQMREPIRYRHYSLRTEQTYLCRRCRCNPERYVMF